MLKIINDKTSIIKGGFFEDSRGMIRFVNNFNFSNVKRFYTITHPDKRVVRAWQGHKIEHKFFFVTKGKFIISWVEVDDWENPSKKLKSYYKMLSADNSEVLSIPPGHANGLKAIENDSQIMVFSSLTLSDAKNDQYRFNQYFWLDWDKFN